MTNPDNVGWLPELPEPYQTVTIINHDASTRRTCGLHTDDSMRAYGELCRASPAGGDSWQLEVGDALLKWNRSHPAGPLISIGYEYGVAAKVAEIMRDSAPAGSGEVSIGAAWLELVANRWDKSQKISPMECDRLLSIAALLRKLQQGADYVMVPREPTSKMAALGAIAHKERGMAAAYRAMIAASQGQEGGNDA